MNEDEIVERERVGPPMATLEIWDCRITFRRQAGTNDVWLVVTGPRGTFASRLIEGEVLRRVQAGRASRDASRDESSRHRTRSWTRVRIDQDLIVGLRARGQWLEYAFLFGDGAGFGGGASGLPTLRQPGLGERVALWLSGARGSPIHFAYAPDRGLADEAHQR